MELMVSELKNMAFKTNEGNNVAANGQQLNKWIVK
jgi:hypothetical protein